MTDLSNAQNATAYPNMNTRERQNERHTGSEKVIEISQPSVVHDT